MRHTLSVVPEVGIFCEAVIERVRTRLPAVVEDFPSWLKSAIHSAKTEAADWEG
jgi:hypothetical protein